MKPDPTIPTSWMYSVDDDVLSTVHSFHLSPSLQGYAYVCVGVQQLLYSSDSDINITTIYDSIGEFFNTTGSRVERAIRHAIEQLFDRGLSSELQRVVNFTSPSSGKATCKEFLYAIALEVITQRKSKRI